MLFALGEELLAAGRRDGDLSVTEQHLMLKDLFSLQTGCCPEHPLAFLLSEQTGGAGVRVHGAPLPS